MQSGSLMWVPLPCPHPFNTLFWLCHMTGIIEYLGIQLSVINICNYTLIFMINNPLICYILFILERSINCIKLKQEIINCLIAYKMTNKHNCFT